MIAIGHRIWTSVQARTPEAMAAAWGWAFLAITLPSPVLFTWYLVWALPLAWMMPKIARRGMVILSAFFVVTQLVTETLVEEVSIDLLKGMQHQADYKAVNPQATVPSLIPDDGGACKDAVNLNNLDDWTEFHRAVLQ